MYILDGERNNEYIDFTIICVLLLMFFFFLSPQFLEVNLHQFLTLYIF